MAKYKLLWFKCFKSHSFRVMFGIETWKDSLTDNEWLGIILGWLVYIIVVVSASPITLIILIITTIKDIMYARRQVKANNQTFINNALKYKLIKEGEDE